MIKVVIRKQHVPLIARAGEQNRTWEVENVSWIHEIELQAENTFVSCIKMDALKQW